MRFQASPSPELFSSDEPVVPRGGDASLENVRCKGQWDAGRYEVDDQPQGDWNWRTQGQESCAVTQAGDGGHVLQWDSCARLLLLQLDWRCRDPVGGRDGHGSVVNVLCMQVYDQLNVKPPIKRHVKMMQAGDNAHLWGFVAGPFDVRIEP